jgi:hypothetical protein
MQNLLSKVYTSTHAKILELDLRDARQVQTFLWVEKPEYVF